MEVILLTSLAGARDAWNAGDKYECSDEEAARLIERGFAKPVREKKVERAVKRRKKAEKAVK